MKKQPVYSPEVKETAVRLLLRKRCACFGNLNRRIPRSRTHVG